MLDILKQENDALAQELKDRFNQNVEELQAERKRFESEQREDYRIKSEALAQKEKSLQLVYCY